MIFFPLLFLLESAPIALWHCSEPDHDGCGQDGFDDCSGSTGSTAFVADHTSSVAIGSTSSVVDGLNVALTLHVTGNYFPRNLKVPTDDTGMLDIVNIHHLHCPELAQLQVVLTFLQLLQSSLPISVGILLGLTKLSCLWKWRQESILKKLKMLLFSNSWKRV